MFIHHHDFKVLHFTSPNLIPPPVIMSSTDICRFPHTRVRWPTILSLYRYHFHYRAHLSSPSLIHPPLIMSSTDDFADYCANQFNGRRPVFHFTVTIPAVFHAIPLFWRFTLTCTFFSRRSHDDFRWCTESSFPPPSPSIWLMYVLVFCL